MPIYEYKCKDCGAVFTVLQPMSAKRTGTKCAKCGGTNTERQISSFSAGGSSKCSVDSPFT